MQGHHLVDHLLDEGVGRVLRRIHHVVVEVLRRRVDGPVPGVTERVLPGAGGITGGGQASETSLHGLDRRPGVARHFDLGDHFDVARGRVLQDLDVVVRANRSRCRTAGRHRARIRTPAAGAFAEVQRVAAACADVGQFRKPRDRQTPAFVFREVEVQGVELVARHQVQHPQHGGLGLEVPRHVQVQAAVTEPRARPRRVRLAGPAPVRPGCRHRQQALSRTAGRRRRPPASSPRRECPPVSTVRSYASGEACPVTVPTSSVSVRVLSAAPASRCVEVRRREAASAASSGGAAIVGQAGQPQASRPAVSRRLWCREDRRQ